MAETLEKLKKEIQDLEQQLQTDHFGGLFDRNRQDQIYHKLKKKRKELAQLEKPAAEPAKSDKPAKRPPPRKKTGTDKKPRPAARR